MSLVLKRDLGPSAIPVHVLIVVVGSYLSRSKNLTGAAAFTQELVDFWRDGNRLFPRPQELATINVLASDPDGEVTIEGSQSSTIDRPTFQKVRDALQNWAQLIAEKDGGVGILHWIGHGTEHVFDGGSLIGLSCDGPKAPGSTQQAAIGWTRAINVIDQITQGHPVYCFIDACRTRDTSERDYLHLDVEPDWKVLDNAHVFTSTSRLEQAFWITETTDAAVRSGCNLGPLGSRAFLAALSGFGARYNSSADMPILAEGLLEASKALVMRWAHHLRLPCGSPGTRPGSGAEPILYSRNAMSSVDVMRPAVEQHSCEASADSVVNPSETAEVPYQFRLSRKPHKFRFDGHNWSADKLLVHPHVTFDAQEFE